MRVCCTCTRLRQCIPSLPPPPPQELTAAVAAGGPTAALDALLLKAAAMEPDVYFAAPQSNASVSSREPPAAFVLPAPLPAGPTTRAISLRHVHRYGVNLIHLLREVAAAELDWALAVLRRLSGSVLSALQRTEDLMDAEGIVRVVVQGGGAQGKRGISTPAALPLSLSTPLAPPPAQSVFLRVHILELIDSLREREMLPAIFFRQNQIGCEVLAKTALARLESAEAEARKGREGDLDRQRRKLERMEDNRRRWLDRIRDRPPEEWTPEENEYLQKMDGQIAALRAKTDDMTIDREFTLLPPGSASIQVRSKKRGGGGPRSLHARTPAPRPRAQLTELCVITKKDEETIRNAIRGLDRHGAPVRKHAWVWRALLRGVAVHHLAMPIAYRRAVEYFFRMKRLSLIFATDTLGQGINMPCRRCARAFDDGGACL